MRTTGGPEPDSSPERVSVPPPGRGRTTSNADGSTVAEL
jgi:hypothetical protein